MKRRRFLQAIATAHATGLIGQQPAPSTPQVFLQASPQANQALSTGFPKVDLSIADADADTILHFFTVSQFAALEKLGGILMPAFNGRPGAREARAPEFLDFLLEESSAERQQLYQAGLDGLNAEAKRRFGKLFAEVDVDQADELLEPLRKPWTYQRPEDPVAYFLLTAKLDLRTATMNSLEWSEAAKSAGGRGPSGLYWRPID